MCISFIQGTFIDIQACRLLVDSKRLLKTCLSKTYSDLNSQVNKPINSSVIYNYEVFAKKQHNLHV